MNEQLVGVAFAVTQFITLIRQYRSILLKPYFAICNIGNKHNFVWAYDLLLRDKFCLLSAIGFLTPTLLTSRASTISK